MMTVTSTLKMALVSILFFGAMTWLSSCKSDDSVDPKTQRLNELKATWKISQVVNDGNDVTGQYTGMTLTIDGLNYSTTNGGNPWPDSGTYSLNDNDLNTLIRNDNVEVTIDEVTTNTLTLSFNYTSVNGRVDGVTGDFTFSLIK